ncbi:hypothetical protein CEXT_803721 [Caerostris extrusa]|uniref:Uncharacterized protein n=1 Tax=Caerostris extrusa TaxID=172846 RepID=A0AAV4YFZ7_CAEEX|nr:hypothetical protein CEXT_803721 [Caerostris extrusa]
MKSYWKVKTLLFSPPPSPPPFQPEWNRFVLLTHRAKRFLSTVGLAPSDDREYSLSSFSAAPPSNKATGECAKQSSHFTSFASISDDFV